MTSEVLLMNLQAVALGADSATTLSQGRRRIVQAGSEKIFIINEAGPVAAMDYNVATYSGLPWKTVLSEFGASCDTATLPISDYKQRLIAFLADIDKHPALPAHKDDELASFWEYLSCFVQDYVDWLEFTGWEAGTRVNVPLATEALRLYRDAIFIETPAHIDDDEQEVSEKLRDALPHDAARLGEFLAEHLPVCLPECLALTLQEASFPESLIAPLMELTAKSVVLEWLPESASDDCAYIVLAGFGAGDAVPSAVSIKILNAFGGVLQYRTLEDYRPDPNTHPVVVETFAQAGLTKAFLNGRRHILKD